MGIQVTAMTPAAAAAAAAALELDDLALVDHSDFMCDVCCA